MIEKTKVGIILETRDMWAVIGDMDKEDKYFTKNVWIDRIQGWLYQIDYTDNTEINVSEVKFNTMTPITGSISGSGEMPSTADNQTQFVGTKQECEEYVRQKTSPVNPSANTEEANQAK